MNTIQITSPPQAAKSVGRGRRTRQRKGAVQNNNNNNNRNGRPKPKKKKKNPRKQGDSRILAEFGECGVLFAKAQQDPFFFISPNSKLPCVPSGPKTSTQRVAAYTRGYFNTGSNGVGWITFSPYKIQSDAATTTYDLGAPIRFTNGTQPMAHFSIPGGSTGVSTAGFPSGITYTQNPTMRVVAAGLRVECLEKPLYIGGQMMFHQLPNITDSWEGRLVNDLLSFPEATIKRVSSGVSQFAWRFGSNMPMAVVAEQGEFMNLQDFNAYNGQNLAVAITGATGNGNGSPFRFEAVSIFEYSTLIAGAERIQAPGAIKTDSAPVATGAVQQALNDIKGVVTDTHLNKLLEQASKHVGGSSNADAARAAIKHLNL